MEQPPPFPFGNAPGASILNQPGEPMELENDLMDDTEALPPLTLDQKLYNLIVQHLTDPSILMMRKMFAPIAETLDCREIVVYEATLLISDNSLEKVCQALAATIEKVKNSKDRQQDDLLTDIIIGLNETNVLSTHFALILLVQSIDTRMAIPLSKKKIQFIREKLVDCNYKAIRDVLKTAFAELNNIAQVITEQALSNFRPFEDILVDLLDLKSNHCPAIILQSEVLRLNKVNPSFMLRRLADAANSVTNSFRPVAVIFELIGRPYLFPTFGHPGITSTRQWIPDNTTKSSISQITRWLSPSTDNQLPQTFFQYIMLKQPWFLVKHKDRDSEREDSVQFPNFMTSGSCTEVLLILILEAMAAMEENDLPLEHHLNQFNWQHLSDMATFCLLGNQADFEQLLDMLYTQLKELKYRRARGELMRLILHSVALTVYATVVKDILPNNGFKFYDKLKDLYNLLYPTEETNVAAATECLKLVRYFAPAAIWLNFACLKDKLPIEPPANLSRQIENIKEILKSDDLSEEGFSAVIANAYTANTEIFNTKFCQTVIGKLIEYAKPMSVLPFGKLAYKGDVALDITFLESLNFRASQHLLKFLHNVIKTNLEKSEFPSPALIESFARVSSISDVRGATGFFMQEYQLVIKEILPSSGAAQRFSIVLFSKLMFLTEFLSMRIKVLYEPQHYLQFLLSIYDAMKLFLDETNSLFQQAYYLLEAHFLRWFSWCPPMEFLQHADLTLKFLSAGKQHVKFHIFCDPNSFQIGDMGCSQEVMKIYLFHYLRTDKLRSMRGKRISAFDEQIKKFHSLPTSSKIWIPDGFHDVKFNEHFDISGMEKLYQLNRQDVDAFTNGNEVFFREIIANRAPTILLTIFRILLEEFPVSKQVNFPGFCFEILKMLSVRALITNTNTLVEFLLFMMKKSSNDEEQIKKLCHTINEFIFTYEFLTLDRFLFQLVAHPNDDESIRLSLKLLDGLMKDNHYIDSRWKFLTDSLPSWQNMPFCESSTFFSKMVDYSKKFPELTYSEMSRRCSGKAESETINHSEHLAIYYTNLMEKLIPIVEIVFQRMIEQQCYFPVIEKLIIVFKYHPQPATFLYRTLYSFPREYIRHEWISRCVRQIAIQEHYRGQMKYCLLSECFIDKHSTALPMEICLKLIERVSKSTTYKHQPPEFCSRDWRFTELPPAAATLVGANIEMMINKHEPDVLINALLKCAFKRPLDKPFELLNSVGLLLTTLPEFFQRCFLEKFENYIDLPELVEEDKPAKILESFQVDAFLASDNDPLTALAIIHSFIQHSSNAGLTLLFTLVENMQAKVKNESQLMFLLRIIVPQLSRVDEVLTMELGACICKAIVSATKSKEQLVFEDTYCNLLYGIKYFKTGNRENLENLILQFPPKLREKMKYFHTSKEEQNEQLKSKQHALLQQQLSQQQMLQQRQQQQLQHHPSFLSTQVPSVPSSQFVPNMPSQPPPNFPEMSQRFPVVPPPQRLPIPMEIPQPDVKPKIEAEMVAPAVRADTLPGMAFQPTMIRPPDGHDMQQQRAPPMRSNPMPSGMPQMMQQMNMPPSHQMGMNPLHRFGPNMGPPPGQMNQMMPPQQYMSPNTSMPPQNNYMPNPPMYGAPPGGHPNQMPPQDNMMNMPPHQYGMNPMGHHPQMGGMPNQGGLMGQGQQGMMNQQPGMMPPQHMMGPNQGQMPQHMMGGPMPPQNYQFQPGMRPMPPYNMPPGMHPPR